LAAREFWELARRETGDRQTEREAAIEVLAVEDFRIIGSSLGGNLGRRVQFHTGTGEVALRRLGKARAEDIIAE
jgi:chemotaxis receptor (MCP) glutamine deamidase CheD